MWLKISVFENWSDISDICVNLLTGLYMRICVDSSLAGVRCWYPLTGLYVRICDMYMWHCALINYLYVFLNNFKIWFYIYMCVCVCVCVCSVVLYIFGKLYRIFWVKLWNQTRILLDSIMLYIVYNCLLNMWLTPSITIFRLKFSWGIEPLDCFVRCKVKRGSFRRSQ